ncbi:MAG TPA: hypothetical protein VGZ91_13355 [Candidatus Sulfotelmatobacter sp.]|nr:hypothetical protein [Candidatus Sulfotelmatobacter sp.]
MRIRLWLLLSLFAGGVTYLYTSRILGPWEHYVNVEHGTLKAQMGDLYPSWVGTRELLLRRRNPYGADVSHEIQMAYYGHAIDQTYGEPGASLIDEQRFAYPVYVVFLLAPTIHLNFLPVQTWAPLLFVLLTAISVPLWLDFLRWRPQVYLTTAIVLLVLSSPQIVQGLRLRQLGLLVGFLLAMGAWCISRDYLVIAGIVLAFSTLKPQMAFLPVAWFILWSFGSWRKRWPFLAGFGITLASLAGAGEIILPGWPRFFLSGMLAYRHYSMTTSFFTLAFGPWISAALSGLAIAGLLVVAWRNRHAEALSQEFSHTFVLFLITAALFLPLLTPFNQILLLMPVLLIVRHWHALSRVGRSAFGIVVAWPWVTSFVLMLLRPPLDSLSRVPLLPAAMSLLLPFVIVFLAVPSRIRTKQTRLVPADI